MSRALQDLLDTDPITLKEASEIVLRGVVGVTALRAEIRRGNLVVERIGKNLFTTPAAIREMRERCRENPARHASTSTQPIAPGSSATKGHSEELAALKASVSALKSGSLSTSRKSISAGRHEVVEVTPFLLRKSFEST